MAKTIETVLSELGLTIDSPIEDILDKLNEYLVISENEKANVRAASVYTLPSVVRNSEQELKQKMYGVVTDDNKGAAALINKRTVLLSTLLGRIKDLSESNENRLNSFDLGEITESPSNIVNSTLNAIRTAGVYKFKYGNQGYLMLVEGSENNLVQTVIYTTGLDSIYEFNRSCVNNVWSIGQNRKLANTNDVELLAEIINRDFQKKLIDAFDADTILESINQNGKASVEQALRAINYWTTQIGAFIEEVFTGKIVKKAIADQKGNVIDAVYQPKLISGYSVGSILCDINEIDGKASIEKSLKQINIILGNFNQYISNIINGTTVVDKAKNDRNGNVIDLTYATKNALNALENKISQLITGAPEAYNTLKEIADYINEDKTGASSMLANINKNTDDIAKIKIDNETNSERIEALENKEHIGLKGTTVPNVGHVKMIYFNTSLSIEKVIETIKLLSEYMIEESDGITTNTSFIVSATNDVKLNISWTSLNEYAIYTNFNGEITPIFDSINGWNGISELLIDSEVNNTVFGIPVGNENYKLIDVLSITPFDLNDFATNHYVDAKISEVEAKLETTIFNQITEALRGDY